MNVVRRTLVLLLVAAVGLGLAACSRKITRVEQVVQGPSACFECHSDTSTFLLAATEAWEHSKHASGSTLAENFADCKGCHTSEGFVARATGTTAPSTIDNPTAIGCFTCHAPHSNGDFRLRWTTIATLRNGVTYDLKGGNTCAACHRSRNSVTATVTAQTTLSQYWGPHHNGQADMLIGSNGYEYNWYTYERSSHRSATDDGCLDCHMKHASGIVLGGHSFNMAYGEGADEIQNTAACAKCHGAIDDFDVDGVQTEVDVMLSQLSVRLESAGLMSGGVVNSVATSADSAGALWNYLLVRDDRSEGVHNANYEIGLLESSIQFLQGGPGVASFRARHNLVSAHR